jgi:hypothetical protein
MYGPGWTMLAVIGVALAFIGLVVACVPEDAKEMRAKESAFMEQCLAERQDYDCRLQWETFMAVRR